MNQNNEQNKTTLYIPLGLKLKTEYFEGFGKSELIRSFIAVAAAGITDSVIYLFSGGNMVICVLFMMVAVAGSVMAFTKDVSGISVADYISFVIRFTRSQKVYRYVYTEGLLKQNNDIYTGRDS